MPDYSERLICYIDILGFKDVIDGLRKNDLKEKHAKIESLDTIFNFINTSLYEMKKKERSSGSKFAFADTEREYVQFSDTIVITMRNLGFWSFWQMCTHIFSIHQYLLQNNLVCRGAVDIGEVKHEGGKIFGPGLVDAYLLESKCALYPRVIFSSRAFEEANACTEATISVPGSVIATPLLLEHYLAQDVDGLYYVDYIAKFLPLKPRFDVTLMQDNLTGYLSLMRDVIFTGIEQNKKNVYVRQKYEWMRSKYDAFVYQIRDYGHKYRDEKLQEIPFLDAQTEIKYTTEMLSQGRRI